MSDDKNGWVDGKYVFPLEAPILSEEGETRELTFRKPTAADQLACGNPVKFDPFTSPPTIEIRDREMGAMIARLSTLSPVAIGRMTPKDLINAGWVLAPFFIPV